MLGGFTEIWLAFLVLWIWLRVLIAKRPAWVGLGRFPYVLGLGAVASFGLAFYAISTGLPGMMEGDANAMMGFHVARGLGWAAVVVGLVGNVYFTWEHMRSAED